MTATITTSTKIATRGFLFDIYHIKDKAILWIKEEENDGNIKRYEYLWPSFVYVVSDKKSELELLLKNKEILSFIRDYEFVYKFEYPSDCDKREVLKLILNDSSQIIPIAKYIENLCSRFDHYRLYNVDVLPEQNLLYDKDFCPLELYDVIEEKNERSNIFDFNLAREDKGKGNKTSKDSFDYLLPNFKYLSFDIVSQKKTKIANNSNDKILKIIVTMFDKKDKNNNIKENFLISKEDESETLLEFSYYVKKLDPDIILTKGGDQYLFPQLLYRAKINKIEYQLLSDLNRESDKEYLQKKYGAILKAEDKENNSNPESSSSFISYGKVYFKPRPFYLYGRIHIDSSNSFIYKDNGLDGLAEISRVCKIPLQIASRSTIGKCLSSLYFYNAQRNEVLIPWKPKISETFKTFTDLLNVDKGGFIFESKPGIYEQVAEFDFVSLYPNIMLKKNVSSETINCNCCRYETDNTVPGLEHLYHTCKKKMGIVPLSLKTVLDRRLEYKNRKKNIFHYCLHYYNNDHLSTSVNNNKKDKLLNCYDNRQSALKWILVTSFGYLGFSNSKFGRIDAHIAVCAFAKDILLKVSKIVETNGFEIIHGIVDSIWIRKKTSAKSKSENKTIYEILKKEIEDKTGFSISFEGIYKWIVFDSSKEDNMNDLPALNRYFGVFEDGAIKIRGIEARRHDTPPIFAKFQEELLQKMSFAYSIDDIIKILPNLEDIYKRYRDLIYYKKVHFSELVFTKRISKDSDEYLDKKRNTIESCVIQLLSNSGKSLFAGQEIKYIITDFDNKINLKRAIPIELVEQDSILNYDTTRYCELLLDCYYSIVKHFL
jgi:DNA polymerase I